MDGIRNIEPVTVTRTLALERIDDAGNAAPMLVTFRYDARDPYAVTLSFATAEPCVTWTFARDLLLHGIHRPTGDGDVHIFPSIETSGEAVILLELVGPDGEALVKVRTCDLEPFLHLMRETVPPGTEQAHLDVDEAVAALLSAEQ
jgi:hypothetical protein